MSVEESHELKETIKVDVFVPGHDPRVTTPLFSHTREALLATTSRCFCCGRTESEAGAPLESHHWLIERSNAEAVDWKEFLAFFSRLEAQVFRTRAWLNAHPDYNGDPIMDFVDDQMANGMILDAAHHRGVDEGIHALPFPTWLLQCYGKENYHFSAVEDIVHEDILESG